LAKATRPKLVTNTLFKAHQEDIVKDHLGEYVAIQGNKVNLAYNN
jgi:hypothetical protein